VVYVIYKSLSTLATIVADFGDNLSQKSATVSVFSPFSATVALFYDSVDRA